MLVLLLVDDFVDLVGKNLTLGFGFRNKNNYLRNINNSSYLYKENNNTKDSNAQSKDLYEDIAIDNAILLKKLTENKKFIILTILRCTIQWSLVYSQCYAAITTI